MPWLQDHSETVSGVHLESHEDKSAKAPITARASKRTYVMGQQMCSHAVWTVLKANGASWGFSHAASRLNTTWSTPLR